ncbi:MAG: hypothetical protein V3V78_03935 [Candidatus Woesearchaeota archaeon]
MVLNETAIPLLGPIAKFFTILQGFIGGLFGLYLILVILKWKESKNLLKIMRHIRKEVEEINEKLGKKKRKK